MDYDMVQGNSPTNPKLFDEVLKPLRQGVFPRHTHKYDELYICIGGSATDTINGITGTVLPGDVYVVSSDAVHEQTNMVNFRCCIFKFDMPRLLERVKDTHLSEKTGFRELFVNNYKPPASIHPSANLFVDVDTVRYAEQLADTMKRETDLDILDILFLSLVALLSSRCNRKPKIGSRASISNITEVVYYMEQNFDKPLSLESLAVRAHYSPRHLTRLMRAHYGISPMEYLDSIRMKHACDLLLHTSHSIIQVARLCGFEDNNLFSRHFRSALGISPTAYRQKNSHLKRTAFSDVDIIK